MPRITIKEPGKSAQPYRLKTDRRVTKFGRGSDNDIILSAGSASTYHCEMKRVDGGFILEDNNSTNGILLDETRFEIIDLKDGMTVNIGDDIEMKFELGDNEIDILDEEDFVSKERVMFPKSKKNDDDDDDDEDDDDEDDDDEYEEIVVVKKKKKKKKRVVVEEDDDDDDDDYDDDKPKKAKLNTGSSNRPSSSPVQQHYVPSGGGFGSMFLFLILAIFFLFAGLAVRHWQEFGNFIFSK